MTDFEQRRRGLSPDRRPTRTCSTIEFSAAQCVSVSAVRDLIAERLYHLSAVVQTLLKGGGKVGDQVSECEILTNELFTNAMLYGILKLSSEEALVVKFPSEDPPLNRQVEDRLLKASRDARHGFMELFLSGDRFTVRVSDGTEFAQFEMLRSTFFDSQQEKGDFSQLRGRGLSVIFSLVDRSERDPRTGVVTYEKLLLTP